MALFFYTCVGCCPLQNSVVSSVFGVLAEWVTDEPQGAQLFLGDDDGECNLPMVPPLQMKSFDLRSP